jgi:hypothetical protein
MGHDVAGVEGLYSHVPLTNAFDLAFDGRLTAGQL